MSSEHTPELSLQAALQSDYDQVKQYCILVEESQRRRLTLTESITTANLRYMETGSMSQMAEIIVKSCMIVTGSSFGMAAELLGNGNASVLALCTEPSGQSTGESTYHDIQYEIRRHGSFELQRHASPFFTPLESGVLFRWQSGQDSWGSCSCSLCAPPFTSFAGIPLRVGATVVGAIYLANHTSETFDTCRAELESHAQTCALALNGARSELERKQANDQLRQAQKMEAIGQLAGGIAHDFNNLLTVINGYSSLLLKKVSGNEAARRDVEQIMNAGERATTLIRHLLAFSRRQILDLQIIDINSLIASIHKFLCRLIDESIALTTRLSPDLGVVKADAGQIEQIIMNLVINARDAMPHGGSIFIETSNTTIDADFTRQNRGSSQGDYVMIVVRDTGVGMSSEVIRRIFEPFYTTKGQCNGTGLGLATVYGIVKQSNGYIQVSSELGLGSEFRVYLPRTQHSGSPAAAHETTAPSPQQTDDTNLLLIVEDESAVLELTAITLRSRGYNVLTAPGPMEALRLFDKYAERIVLMVSDVMMPEMSGVDLARALRLKRPGLKVVLMSGYTDEKLKSCNLEQENFKFIMKPFSPSLLIRVVGASLAASGMPSPQESPLHE